ncbi:MAG: YicC/YloC family endoribonuclease [Thermodesulfobacteriota bacterium]
MIISMTAFAETRTERNGFVVDCEIRTYNSRYLDASIRLPARYRHCEGDIKQLISQRIQRGRVEMSLFIRDERDQPSVRYEVDAARAAGYHNALVQLRDTLGLNGEIPLDLIARAEGVITSREPEAPGEFEWNCIREAVETTIEALNEMRRKEGAFLAADLSARMDTLETIVSFVRGRSADLMAEYYERVRERVRTLVNEMVQIDETRIAQEAAFYVDKADISEEIVRAESHIDQFRKAVADDQPCGRKLNFLLQEFNREFNTMGSKTGNPDVSERVVTAKIELEKLREQVQNVE